MVILKSLLALGEGVVWGFVIDWYFHLPPVVYVCVMVAVSITWFFVLLENEY